MTTPALQRLRERFPGAQITLLTHEKLAGLWEQHSCVNSVLTLQDGQSPWSVARVLKRGGFDTALILPNSPRSALESWLAGIPRRIGYTGAWRNFFLSRSVKHPPGRSLPRQRGVNEIKQLTGEGKQTIPSTSTSSYQHQIHDYLNLAATIGANPSPLAPKLEISPQEVEMAAVELQKLLGQKRRDAEGPIVWLGINAAAAYGPAKCWPVERFAEVTSEVSKVVPNCVWLSFGSQADRNLGERLAGLARGTIYNLAGQTSLRQLMAFLKTCSVLLTNDSGPMHVAAALGTAVVVPFGSTSPELTAPGLPGDTRHHLLRTNAACSPCFRRTCPIDFRCMTGITVEQVTGATIAALKSAKITK